MKLNRKARGEDGAALVEMALITPLLLILLLGIIEFGYVFAQYNEVRHAAREGARYAAVSNPDLNGDGTVGNTADVMVAVCNAIDLSNATISVTLVSDGTPQRLENAELTVTAAISSLSNAPIISSFVPDEISNTAVFRLEQDAAWTDIPLNNPQDCP
jgi:Flp pilus assembly protein TadG